MSSQSSANLSHLYNCIWCLVDDFIQSSMSSPSGQAMMISCFAFFKLSAYCRLKDVRKSRSKRIKNYRLSAFLMIMSLVKGTFKITSDFERGSSWHLKTPFFSEAQTICQWALCSLQRCTKPSWIISSNTDILLKWDSPRAQINNKWAPRVRLSLRAVSLALFK